MSALVEVYLHSNIFSNQKTASDNWWVHGFHLIKS